MRTDAPLTFRKQGNDAIRCEGLSLQNFLGYLESNLDGHNVPADVSHLEGLPLAAASQPVLVLEIQEVLSLDSRASYRNQSCVKTIVKQKRMHSDMQSFGHCTLRMAWMYACWMDLSTIFHLALHSAIISVRSAKSCLSVLASRPALYQSRAAHC